MNENIRTAAPHFCGAAALVYERAVCELFHARPSETERGFLFVIGVLQCVVPGFARTHAHHFLNVVDEDLAVADVTGVQRPAAPRRPLPPQGLC